MRKLYTQVLGWGLLFCLGACNQTSEIEQIPKQETFSLESKSLQLEGDYRIRASFSFNQAVDAETVELGRTLFLFAGEDNQLLSGSIHWKDDHTFFFLSDNDIMQICGNGYALCDIEVLLIGNDAGDGAVRSLAGLLLDGNGNTQPGGDYIASIAY
jgi:hypothetical protein